MGEFGQSFREFKNATRARWLGWQDSNLRMTGSKPVALPLGDTPSIVLPIITTNAANRLVIIQRIRMAENNQQPGTLQPADYLHMPAQIGWHRVWMLALARSGRVRLPKAALLYCR